MRALALLLSVPLSAGDKPALEKAVELFKSPDAGERAAGSQLAERELRKLLAPLLRAMEDDDPEVRRRARWSILSLVPVAAGEEPLDCAEIEMMHKVNLQWRACRLRDAFGVWTAPSDGCGRAEDVVVRSVRSGSPAARLGLSSEDRIVRVNGQAIKSIRDFPVILGDKPDWSRITVTVLRNERDVLRLPKK